MIFNKLLFLKPVKWLVKKTAEISMPGNKEVSLYAVLEFFIRNIGKSELNLRASALAFNFFLALFPTVIFFFTLIAYLPLQYNPDEILFFIAQAIPPSTYETIKENVKSSVLLDIEANGLNKSKMGVLAGLTKLRQVCNSPELVKNEDLFCTDSIKTDLLVDELKNLVPHHKTLVFSQFTAMLDLLEQALTRAKLPFLRLDGQTPPHERQALVNRFQCPDSPAHIFLISLKAGNAGLNLTAAEYVFLVDPWWNQAVENQAIDRTHRIGQAAQVFAYRLICKDSIEEKIMRLSSKKKVLAEDLVTADESFVKSLTLEDIAYLLQ